MFITWKIESWLVSWNIVQAVKTLWSVDHWAGVVKGRRLNTHISPILKLFLGDCSVLCCVSCVRAQVADCIDRVNTGRGLETPDPRPGGARRWVTRDHQLSRRVTLCHAAARCEDNAELRLGHCCLCPVSGLCTVTGHRAATGLASQHTLELQSKVREVFTIHGEGPTRVTTAFTFRNLKHYAKELTQGK